MTSFARPTARGDATRRRESFESFETYLGAKRAHPVILSKLTFGTPSSVGMVTMLCAASAPQARTLDTLAVVVHASGGRRMRKSSNSTSSSSNSSSGFGRGMTSPASGAARSEDATALGRSTASVDGENYMYPSIARAVYALWFFFTLPSTLSRALRLSTIGRRRRPSRTTRARTAGQTYRRWTWSANTRRRRSSPRL